eukprot:9822986-Prorocentrum_lima.AAC.1
MSAILHACEKEVWGFHTDSSRACVLNVISQNVLSLKSRGGPCQTDGTQRCEHIPYNAACLQEQLTSMQISIAGFQGVCWKHQR